MPFYRLPRSEIARAWGSATLAGEKAVANYDEDSLTMGVAAALDCMQGLDRSKIDGLYFASTTSPYKEKQCATTIATILGLPSEAMTIDFSGSLRCGSNALKAAMDAVDNGTAKNILVCVADTRLGYPFGPNELTFGDGAAAVIVGNSESIVQIEHFYTRHNEIQDIWRSDKDNFVRSAEDRFAMDEGYANTTIETVSALLKRSGLTAKDFTKIALYAPNTRQLRAVTQKLGFDEKTQVQDILHNSVGDTGSAMSVMSLIAALEPATQGQRILFASYGNGCDVFVLITTDSIAKMSGRRGIRKNLAAKGLITNYSKYLRWRELVQVQPPARPPVQIANPRL
jgi:3-hydroxy-3-methylglutaryl CoA synthase